MVANVNSVVAPIDKNRQTADSRAVAPMPGEGKIMPETGNSEPVAKPVDLSASIEKTVEQISEFVNANARGLRFRVDDASGRTIVTVLNPNSGEIIRQIPSEEFLHIASELRRYGEVHLIDKEA
jgi:flagellar protein FlaG